MSDHYGELGVARDASADEIRKAYRRKASKAHPDRAGGDVVSFQRIQKAYDILGDGPRRARYDSTGLDDERDARAKALEAVATLFLQALDKCDVDRTDVVSVVCAHINHAIGEVQSELRRIEQSIRKRRRALKRIRLRGEGHNRLAAIVEADIANHEQALARGRELLAERRQWLAIAAEYSYEVDSPPSAATTTMSLRFIQS